MTKIIVLFTVFLSFFQASAEAALPERTLKEKATAFIKAKNARQQPSTQVQDIDHFISLLADDFIDEHVKYQVTITDKSELYQSA